MRLNVDCVRDLLIVVEDKTELNRPLDLSDLKECLSDYSDDDIVYTALKLEEAGFIKCSTKNVRIYPDLLLVRELTYYGHQFLEDVRVDSNWEKVKSIGKKVGSTSISALSQIASSVIANLVNAHL